MKTLLTKLCLFNLLLIFRVDVCAQSDSLKIDSLKEVLQTQKEDTNKVKTLNELSLYVLQKDDFDNAMQLAQQSLLLAEKTNFKKGKADAYFNISSVLGVSTIRTKPYTLKFINLFLML